MPWNRVRRDRLMVSGDLDPGLWRTLLGQTRAQLDVLVYAGSLLFEAYDFVETVRGKAAAGASIRIRVGDPDCDAIRVRSREEGRPAIVDRCRSSPKHLTVISAEPGVQIRSHGTTLYASVFRFDDAMFSVVYRARYIAGEPTCSDETTEVRWVPVNELDALTMDRSQRERLGSAVGQERTRIDPTGG